MELGGGGAGTDIVTCGCDPFLLSLTEPIPPILVLIQCVDLGCLRWPGTTDICAVCKMLDSVVVFGEREVSHPHLLTTSHRLTTGIDINCQGLQTAQSLFSCPSRISRPL